MELLFGNAGAPERLKAAPHHYNANDYTKQLPPLGLGEQRSETVIFRTETLPGGPRDLGLTVHGAETHSPQERACDFLSGSVGRTWAHANRQESTIASAGRALGETRKDD